MKKSLLLTILLSLVIISIEAQELNQAANWPNENWTLSGSYNATFLYENPTTSSGSASFSFDDDDAGGSSINNVAAESPIIDLSGAFNAGETDINVSFQYVFNIYQTETLRLQYWDEDSSSWTNWGGALVENSSASANFCNSSPGSYISDALVITSFTSSQLQNFKYRISYDDNGSFGWGFCVNSVNISSIIPPACPNISSVAVNNIDATSATQLDNYHVQSNSISTIDISSMASLTFFRGLDNSLSTLDISGNPLLTRVEVENNNLSSSELDAIVNQLDVFG